MLGNLRKRLNCSLMLFVSYFHPFLVVVLRKKIISYKFLFSAVGSFEVQGALPKVILKSDGRILWANPAIFKSFCKMNVKYFPFDDQECKLQFGPLTYNLSSSVIMPEKDRVDLQR